MSHFKMSWFVYFFIGLLVLGLAISVTGVNITFWQSYTTAPSTPFETNGLWYSIKRFDNNFWDIFKKLNDLYQYFILEIPAIPLIPRLDTNINGIFVVVNVLIYLVNGLFQLINVITSITNSISVIVGNISAFVNAFMLFIANAGMYTYVPRPI